MWSATIKAQSTAFYSHKREVGTNITNLLGNMLSLTPVTNSQPFALQFAYHGKKNSIRLGLNGNSIKNTVLDVSSNPSFIKTLEEQILSARLCLEKHLPLSNKFQLNYGMDILAGNQRTTSATDNFFLRKLTSNTFGAGPALRFSFKLSNRIHLQTETTLYGRYLNNTDYVDISGQTPKSLKSSDWDIKLQLPAQLFINIEF
jgi:hypothetical protein